MTCQIYTCPFSDGFECFYIQSQCISPAVWEGLSYPSPGFPTELGSCMVPIVNSATKKYDGYINLSIACRHNLTQESITAFLNLKKDSDTRSSSSGSGILSMLSLPAIIGLSIGSFLVAFLIIIGMYAYVNHRLKKKRERHIQLQEWQGIQSQAMFQNQNPMIV